MRLCFLINRCILCCCLQAPPVFK